MSRIKIFNRTLYLILVAACMIIVACGFAYSDTDKSSSTLRQKTQTIEPDNTVKEDNKITYYITLKGSANDNMALAFLSRHQTADVYADGQLIYFVHEDRSWYGSTTGTNYNVVTIPEYTTNIRVEITNIYEGFKVKETTFIYADKAAIVAQKITGSLLSAGICWFIILVGLSLVVCWIASRKVFQTEGLLYLGILTIIFGCWALNETDLILMIIENRRVTSFMGYLLLMMIPVPFILTQQNFFKMRKNILTNVFCAVFTVTDIVLLTLHVTGVCEFKYTVFAIHVMLALSLVYLCIAIHDRVVNIGFDRKVKVNILATFALAVSMAVDLFAYYRGFQQTDILGKLGILFYIVILSVESASDAYEKIKEGQKAQFYRDLAVTDAMTGLYNRTAFESWEECVKDYTDIGIVTFDLNNLKWRNDNLGHAEGDAYIVMATGVIKAVLARHGKCYRIGGDEFCTVIMKGKGFDYERHIKRIQKEFAAAAKECRENGKMGIACGYAMYDGSVDKDFEDTRGRADTNMYEDKKTLKSEHE